MTLMRRNEVFPDLPSFFDDFFTREWFNNDVARTRTTMPAVNIEETDDEFRIEVAAPGYKKNDFKVELNNDVLTISSEKKFEDDGDNKMARREFYYESFSRSFRLPENVVNGEKINAQYENGLLHINLPKKEEVKPQPARLISIK